MEPNFLGEPELGEEICTPVNREQTTAFEKLRAIDWVAAGKGTFDPLTYQMFFDYAAVAANICKRHGLEGGFYQRLSGLFDFVPRLVGDEAALPSEVEAWCTQDLFEAYRWRSRWYVVPAAIGFVRWGGLSPALQQHITGHEAAQNPYDLLFTFFERGGAFSCEHNMLDRVYPEPPTFGEVRQGQDASL